VGGDGEFASSVRAPPQTCFSAGSFVRRREVDIPIYVSSTFEFTVPRTPHETEIQRYHGSKISRDFDCVSKSTRALWLSRRSSFFILFLRGIWETVRPVSSDGAKQPHSEDVHADDNEILPPVDEQRL
jgi:hypothetical protein